MTYVTRHQKAERRRKKIRTVIIIIIAIAVICLAGALFWFIWSSINRRSNRDKINFPTFSGSPYIVINNNKPFFGDEDYITTSFESYSELDNLGRCGVAYANISRDLMPIEDRGEIGSIKPTGWVQNKYEGIIQSTPPYLYNRCHLIAYCLTAENSNERNLITGTRYMNVNGMLPFEEKVARYLDENDNHVLYRVTPIFMGENLLADGVLMEAYSVEDSGEGICFCVFCYNVQPGIIIDYKTGENRIE